MSKIILNYNGVLLPSGKISFRIMRDCKTGKFVSLNKILKEQIENARKLKRND